jgi:hypothetical protein
MATTKRDQYVSASVTVFLCGCIILFFCCFTIGNEESSQIKKIPSGSGDEGTITVSWEPAQGISPMDDAKEAGSNKEYYSSPDGIALNRIHSDALDMLKSYTSSNKSSANDHAGVNNDPVPGKTPFRGTMNIPADGDDLGSDSVKFRLAGRKLLTPPAKIKDSKEEGTVEVIISVDENGFVVAAEASGRQTTTSSSVLKLKARQAALSAKFDAAKNPGMQTGSMIFRFEF